MDLSDKQVTKRKGKGAKTLENKGFMPSDILDLRGSDLCGMTNTDSDDANGAAPSGVLEQGCGRPQRIYRLLGTNTRVAAASRLRPVI